MSLIGIKLDEADEYLDITNDTTIELTLENPLLGDAEKLSPGSYSMPFNLPAGDASPKNARLLKNPDVIENADTYVANIASLFFDDQLLKRGTLKNNNTADKLSCYFLFGLNSLSAELKTAKLKDIVRETLVIDASNFVKKVYVGNDSGDPRVTVNGKSYTGVSWHAVADAINADAMKAAGTGVYVPYGEAITGVSPNGFISGPMLMIWSGSAAGAECNHTHRLTLLQ